MRVIAVITPLHFAAYGAHSALAAQPALEGTTYIDALAKQWSCSPTEAERRAQAVFAAIAGELLKGRAVTIGGFGRFFVYESAAKAASGAGGKNEAPQGSINSDSGIRKRFARFRASNALREKLNQERGRSASTGRRKSKRRPVSES